MVYGTKIAKAVIPSHVTKNTEIEYALQVAVNHLQYPHRP